MLAGRWELAAGRSFGWLAAGSWPLAARLVGWPLGAGRWPLVLSHVCHIRRVESRMLEKLMPRSDEFFDDFDAQADATVRGAKLLLALFDDFTDVERKVAAIKEVEHQGDEIAHRAFERLHKQFITPFDRAEIHRLLGRIDDVLDLTDATAERLLLYEVGAVPQAAKDLARVLVPCCEKMQEAVRAMRTIKNPAEILAACRAIKTYESDADA